MRTNASRIVAGTLILAAGCASPAPSVPLVRPPAPIPQTASNPSPPRVQFAEAVEPADPPSSPPTPGTSRPFDGKTELAESDLVAQVLARNPTVAQMTAAAQAAAARIPQVTSLEDPRAGGFVGPASIGSRAVDFAYRVEVSQAIPFPGKLTLRGVGAGHEAAAAGAEVEDARLTLAEAARTAFADYYLAARAAEVNEEGLQLLREFRENAANRYRTGQGQQQDVLQADVTIARQRERAVGLDRARRVAQARINTLLNAPADQSLPPPPKERTPPGPLPAVADLREAAVGRRPDIAALRSRVAADGAALALALKEYYPDFEAMAAYDAWWQKPERDLRPMIGLRFNLPIRTDRRDAAVAEMRAKLAQRQAEVNKLVAQVGLQVQEAYEQAREAEQAQRLYEETALPAARENIKQAQAGYTVGRIPFLNLIEAQRNLIELRDRQIELLAEARRRRAALDRAAGVGAGEPASAPGVTFPVPVQKAKPTTSPSIKPFGPPVPPLDGKGLKTMKM
jgi:outer membrane protein, heavy metal efflux system